MKKLIYIFLFLLAFKMQAQAPSKFYTKFGGDGIDIGNAVRETYNRQYIVTGSTSSYGFGTVDAFLLLIDSMGKHLWEKPFGGALTDVSKALVINPIDSGFVFTGYTNSFGNGGYDVFVVRTDKNGNLIWQKSFGGFDWDFGDDITLAPDGNVVVCGNSYSSIYGKTDGVILKINIANGALIWQKYYGGSEDDDFKAIKTTSDGKFILTGKTNSYKDIKGDIYFFKTDLNGDSIHSKTLGQPNKIDIGNDIIAENTNDYFIGGGTESYSSGKKDAFFWKLTSQGDSVRITIDGMANQDEETKKILLFKNSQSNYAMLFTQVSLASHKKDPRILALNTAGFYESGGSFGGLEDDELFGLANTSDKGAIGVGYTKSFGSNSEDLYIVKYDSTAIMTIGLSVINVKEIKANIDLFRVYPSLISETSSEITVQKSNNNRKMEFELFDITGKQLKIDVKVSNSNPNDLLINLNNIKPGIYLLIGEINGYHQCVKLIKQ